MIFRKEAAGQKNTSTVRVKYDCGFPNNLFIRGTGAGLSWEKGLPLKNVKPNEWVWETKEPFTLCEFKVLINDRSFERGENRLLAFGEQLTYIPIF
jgi:hypothetical protein